MAQGAIRILGLDPGTARTGYGLVIRDGSAVTAPEYGLLSTLSGTPAAERLLELSRDLAELLADLKPDIVAIEQLFFSANRKTALAVAEARGVLLLGCATAGLEIHEYTPPQIKQAVAAFGGAAKGQVAAMVCRLLEIAEPPQPDDVTDALAVALCHLGHVGTR